MNDDPLHTAIPLSRLLLPPEPPILAPGIVHTNFSVQGDARQSFLAWPASDSCDLRIRPGRRDAGKARRSITSSKSVTGFRPRHAAMIQYQKAASVRAAVIPLRRACTASVAIKG